MKVFDSYSIEELREGLGQFDFLDSRHMYNRTWTAYKRLLKSHPSFPEDIRSREISIGLAADMYRENNWFLMVIHILEIPLVDVPLYVNTSHYEEVIAVAEFRLKNGK
jgi:hypothetical protein